MIQPCSVVRTNEDVRYRVIEGEAVVLSQSAGEVVVLDEVGARVLELVGGGAGVESIIERLLAEYDVDRERLEADVVGFLGELLDAKIIVETTSG